MRPSALPLPVLADSTQARLEKLLPDFGTLRNPLDKTMPMTHGIRPAGLLGFGAPTRAAVARTRTVSSGPSSTPVVAAEPQLPTVEIIRGDKRAQEVVRQEQ